MRTQDEIVVRAKNPEVDDLFGFAQEVLVPALDFEHAREFLKDPENTEWSGPLSTEDIEEHAKGYLEFAIGKIIDHRGISASRSVVKLTEYAWLLGRDDVVSEMGNTEYPQYGAPMVRAFALGMGWPWPADNPYLARMELGLPCQPDCEAGCGT